LEQKLDKAYKSGASKKFGYERSCSEGGLSEDEKKIGRIEKQAKTFLERGGSVSKKSLNSDL